MRLTAQDLHRLKLVDTVIAEPLGGAHRDAEATVDAVGDAIADGLLPLSAVDGPALKMRRRDKFLEMGREGLL
jgi:acetyl-CoA carboxylase carboxyl transferase subunit alpha